MLFPVLFSAGRINEIIFAELPLSHPVTPRMLVPLPASGTAEPDIHGRGGGGGSCVPVPKEVIRPFYS